MSASTSSSSSSSDDVGSASQRRARQRRRSSAHSTSSSTFAAQQKEYAYAIPETSISEWLKCPICLNPFVDPLLAPSCEHVFCEACIVQHFDAVVARQRRPDSARRRVEGTSRETASDEDNEEEESGEESRMERQGPCPTCRNVFTFGELKPAASLIRNMVDSLLVKCPHESRGCTYTCERGHVATHARRDCLYAYVGEYGDQSEEKMARSDKQHDGGRGAVGRCECGKRVLRKDWQTHVTMPNECTVSRMECPFAHGLKGCNTLVKECDLEEHMDACEARPTQCLHCRQSMTAGELDVHTDECKEVEINCPLERFGCIWTGRRADLGRWEGDATGDDSDANAHLSSCKLAPLRTFLEAQLAHAQELQHENEVMRTRMRSLEREQKSSNILINECTKALGGLFVSESRTDIETARNSSRHTDVVVPISSPVHRSGGRASPPLALRGRPGSSLSVRYGGLSRDSSVPTSTSAPATASAAPLSLTEDADFPWHWPEAERNSERTSATTQLVESTANAPQTNDHVTVSESIDRIYQTLAHMTDQMSKLERRMDDSHVVSLNAGFEAGRAHDELNSVRHGMHSIRLQMHSLLMQQQMERSMQPPLFTAPSPSAGNHVRGVEGQAQHVGPSAPSTHGQIGLRRFWAGFEQTKL